MKSFCLLGISKRSQSLSIGLVEGAIAALVSLLEMTSVESAQSIRAFLTSNWSNTLMYITRLVTIFSCLLYFLGSLFGNTYPWYQRALIANAATFALRLHQRIAQRGNQPRLSQESVQLIVSEDSLHYLLYSVIFLLTPPVTVALAPIFCFASLHCLGFTQNLLTLYIGKTERPHLWTRRVCDIVSRAQSHSDNILRIIAIHEILLMVISIVLAFSSRIPLLPFFYYHFLKLRYASRRNPYCRRVFSELRIAFYQLADHLSSQNSAHLIVRHNSLGSLIVHGGRSNKTFNLSSRVAFRDKYRDFVVFRLCVSGFWFATKSCRSVVGAVFSSAGSACNV
ncbi:Transmembrane protein 33 [Taenia crassiceps]|uniref:Transmembrane protein 33 n=1 Tax=Taenia crassiceps TaxID=6207 RepID=A0ABR4QN34_9CEST